jgi:hypothetical protein
MNIENADVNILLSRVNMKLRDEFRDLDDLAAYYDIKKDDLEKKLGENGYIYSALNKQFIKNTI